MEPFARVDGEDDARFYSVPRKVVHLEPGAIEALRAVYAEHFAPGGTVLDLMSSWRSHLPDGLRRGVGVGMNDGEMGANPQTGGPGQHDLKRGPRLPCPAAPLDAGGC